MKFGLIKERKTPPDARVVLPPVLSKQVLGAHPEMELWVEASDIRAYTDSEYSEQGIPVVSEMESCEVLLGVKEVPIDALIPGKKYFFFSHTIKKQPYNRKLLQAILDRRIELYDHETITNAQGVRLVAFGRYAGIVGTYNGFRAYGLKSGRYGMPKAGTLHDKDALIAEMKRIPLPPIKVLLTGKGRVGMGAREMLVGMGLKEVSVTGYLADEHPGVPIFCQIDVLDYNRRKDGTVPSDVTDFFQNPGEYETDFPKFAQTTDLYVAGHFFGEGAPNLLAREDYLDPNFRISVIADISCDINGPIASTIRASTIADPIYGYDPVTGKEADYKDRGSVAVMAVDNLPAELPRESSNGFGEAFAQHVIPAFFNADADGILERARMTKDGRLTERYAYLADYVAG